MLSEAPLKERDTEMAFDRNRGKFRQAVAAAEANGQGRGPDGEMLDWQIDQLAAQMEMEEQLRRPLTDEEKVKALLSTWEDTPKKAPDLSDWDPRAARNETERQATELRIARLEELIPETADKVKRDPLIAELARRRMQLEQMQLSLPPETTREGFAEMTEQAQMRIESAAVAFKKLLAEGFEEDSVTVKRAEREHKAAIEELVDLDRRGRYTFELLPASDQSDMDMARDMAEQDYRREIQRRIDALERANAPVWELERARHEATLDFSLTEGAEERIQAALTEVRAESQARRQNEYIEREQQLYGVAARTELGLPNENSAEPTPEEALSSEADDVIAEIEAIRATVDQTFGYQRTGRAPILADTIAQSAAEAQRRARATGETAKE